jgi:PhoH-like ATPase
MKTHVVDTNVLIDNENFFAKFDEDVFIPFVVLEELDKLKTKPGVGYICRKHIKTIEMCRAAGTLLDGVEYRDDCDAVLTVGKPLEASRHGLNLAINDNALIESALLLLEHGFPAQVLSNDLNVRVKAGAYNVPAFSYDGRCSTTLFTGQQIVTVEDHEVDLFYQTGEMTIDYLDENEFVTLVSRTNQKHSALGIYKNGVVKKMRTKFPELNCLDIKPRSKEQIYALNLLLDPNVPLVTLAGVAGTGKSFQSLAAALVQIGYPMFDQGSIYDRIIVTTPVVSMGNDIGYLPGSLEEKMSHWIAPLQDNLKSLLGYQKDLYDDFVTSGLIEIEAMTFMRGRSLENCLIIIDEAQNISHHELKTLLTRVGKGSKIILTGDPDQIDASHLDKMNNGLSICANKFRAYDFAGHVTLTKCERSRIADVASKIL